MAPSYAEQIKQIISPVVGDYVANVALNFQCKYLGITPDEIKSDHLDELSERIGNAIQIQGKEDEANIIKNKIKRLK